MLDQPSALTVCSRPDSASSRESSTRSACSISATGWTTCASSSRELDRGEPLAEPFHPLVAVVAAEGERGSRAGERLTHRGPAHQGAAASGTSVQSSDGMPSR